MFFKTLAAVEAFPSHVNYDDLQVVHKFFDSFFKKWSIIPSPGLDLVIFFWSIESGEREAKS